MRKPRRIVEGARYHIVARANRSEFILLSDSVKNLMINVIALARKRYTFSLDTLCLMDNHIHLLIRPGRNESLSRIMQWVLSVFALRFNRRFGLIGHVWYDRFKSVVLGNLRQYERAFTYIRDNPVQARVARQASEYRYGGLWIMRGGFVGVVGPPDAIVALRFPGEVVPRLTG